MLKEVVGESWARVLQSDFDSEYMQKLSKWLHYTRQSKTIYPDSPDVFRALKLCPFGQVKVVILGKEPYYQGNADGLAFSYKNGERKGQGKQALDVILDEIEQDCYNGFELNKNYELDYLAKQGVLLLNSRLTVFRGEVDSHKNLGWEKLTKAIINSQINEPSPKVFMLWGKEAQQSFYNIQENEPTRRHDDKYMQHIILNSYHPAYDLHKRDSFGNITVKYPDGFTGGRYFSKANQFLLNNGMSAIDWLPIFEPYNNEKLSDQPPF